MLISEIIKQAFADLRANRLRSVLTLFGIIWGIMAIMILLGWGFGFRDLMQKGFGQIGEDLVVIIPGHTSIGVGGYRTGRTIVPETKDIEAIAHCPSVAATNPQTMERYEVKYNANARQYSISGVLPVAKQMNNWSAAQGRFISDEDINNRRRFAFIGNNVKEQLFGVDAKPVGEKIKINGVTFSVLGVAVEKKVQMSQINSRHDDQVLIPLSTAQQLFGDGRSLDLIFVTPAAGATSSQVVTEARGVMAKLHHFDPEDQEALMILEFAFFEKMLDLLTLGLNLLLGLIGVITLFIGGVGVMNIMFVSVKERTREIGIRKSVGARKRDIRLQFLAESFFITSIGGIIGFALGSALLGLISLLPLPPFIPIPQNSVELSLIVVAVMIITGVISGYIPAKNAAELQPVKALYYERGEDRAGGRTPKPLWVARTLTGELIGEAFTEMRSSRSRSMLTMFGIMWGIAAIIVLIGFGSGFRNFFNREFGKMGEKAIYVYGGRVKGKSGDFREGRRVRLSKKDVEALNAYAVEIEQAIPEHDCGFLVVKYGVENRAVHTLGAVPGTLTMRNYKIERGRFLNQGDIDDCRRVCFLGATIVERLFGSRAIDVPGKYLNINGLRYRVVGSAAPKGMQMNIENSLDDEKIFIPVSAALKDFSGDRYLTNIVVSPVDRRRYSHTEREIRNKLSSLHNFEVSDEDALTVYSIFEETSILDYIVLGLQIFLGGVGVVTLLIGSVGVMNIMFFVVTQRTHEIGIRRAVGALKTHIFRQFLIEALALTFVAGLIGFTLGWGLNAGLTVLVDFLRTQSVQLMMLFSPQNSIAVSLLTVFFIVAAGFFAGIMPALRAMRLNIVDSMRYE